MFITENYSSKFKIMTFWTPAPKSPTENGVPKKSLDTSLDHVGLIATEGHMV